VVVASGGNEVLVYRGTGFDASGNPTFAAPVSYPVDTNPVSVTVQYLNGDGVPDMVVANQGSNDVSILFGSWDSSGNWVGAAGPRLKSGGSGPIAAKAVFPTNGSLPQLVITNGQSGTLAVLPGVGQGFFNDQNPEIVSLPGNPVLTQGPTFGASGFGVVVTATGQLVGFDLNDLAGSAGVLRARPCSRRIVGHGYPAALTASETMPVAITIAKMFGGRSRTVNAGLEGAVEFAFGKTIRPLLRDYCLPCHSTEHTGGQPARAVAFPQSADSSGRGVRAYGSEGQLAEEAIARTGGESSRASRKGFSALTPIAGSVAPFVQGDRGEARL
jgi:hypothetical protein